MVVPESGGEWQPLSLWGAQNKGVPASPTQAPMAANRTMAASPDSRSAFTIMVTNPVGGLSAAFEKLGPQRGKVVGIVFGVAFVLSCVLAGYRLKSAIPAQISLGIAFYFKAFALTLVPFASLFAVNSAVRMLFRRHGSWEHDCFIAGASVVPMSLPVLVSCVVGIGENPIVFTLLVAIFAASLACLLLFAGLTQIYRISIRSATFLAPLEFAIMTLAVHVVSKILF
jgi:hypothetical protein